MSNTSSPWEAILVAATSILALGPAMSSRAQSCDFECPNSFSEDPSVLSPPSIQAVSPKCAAVNGAVELKGVHDGATITITVTDASGVNSYSSGPYTGLSAGGRLVVSIPATLTTGDTVVASQTLASVTSPDSSPSVVETSPSSLGAPEVHPRPVWECARLIASRGQPLGATNLTGYLDATAWTTLAGPVSTHHGLFAPVSGFEEGDLVSTSYDFCGSGSPIGDDTLVRAYEGPLPPLSLREGRAVSADGDMTAVLTAGATSIRVGNAVYGAEVFVRDAVTNALLGSSEVFENEDGNQVIPLTSPLSSGTQIRLTQELCDASAPTDVTVQACSELGAPVPYGVQPGDEVIVLAQHASHARVRIYAGDGPSAEEIGDGVGDYIVLTRPVAPGEAISLTQQVGTCVSSYAYRLELSCGLIAHSPQSWDAYDSDSREYELPTEVSLGGRSVRIKGVVTFPTDPVTAAPAHGTFPTIFIMHGNHPTYFSDGTVESYPGCSTGIMSGRSCCEPDPTPQSEDEVPSYRGYQYLAEPLARSGYVVVSINANDLNCSAAGTDYLSEGVALFHEHFDLWSELSSASGVVADDPFGGELDGIADMRRVVVAGHSRGADRALYVAANPPSSIGLLGAIAIAPPWNFERKSVRSVESPALLLYGSRDGDVAPYCLPSSCEYELTPTYGGPLRLFGHLQQASSAIHVMDRANHNQYNSVWSSVSDPTSPVSGTTATNAEQRASTVESIVSFLQWTVRGIRHGERETAGDTTRRSSARVRPAFRAQRELIVDAFEEHGFSKPTVEGSVDPNGAMCDEYSFRSTQGHNDSYHLRSEGAVCSQASELEIRWDLESAMDASTYDYLTIRVAEENQIGGPSFVGSVDLAVGLGASVVATEPGRVVGPDPASWELTLPQTVRISAACLGPVSNVSQITMSSPSVSNLAFQQLVWQ